MATFYIHIDEGKSQSTGKKHANYIAGEDKYDNKKEVLAVVDKNLPAWAKNATDFFSKADEMERANGRPFREFVIAIPHEAKEKGGFEKWAQNFTDELLKDKHAYRLAIHNLDGNPHAHLMFCERGRGPENKVDDPKAYFVRSNPKDREFTKASFLEDTKKLYMTHVKKVAPSFEWSKEQATGQVKVGPKLKKAGPKYEEGRKGRERLNIEIDYTKHNLEILDKQEQALSQPKAAPAPAKAPTSPAKPAQATQTPAPAFNPPSPPTLSGGASKSNFGNFVGGAVAHARVHTHAHAITPPATMRARVALEQVKTNQKLGGAGGGGAGVLGGAQAAIQQVIRETEKRNAKGQVERAQQADKTQREMSQTASQNDRWTAQVSAQAKAQEQRAQQAVIQEHSGPSLARAFIGRDAEPVARVLSDETKRAQFVAQQKAWQNAYNASGPAPSLKEQLNARADGALTIAEQLLIEAKTAPSPSAAPAPRPAFRPF